MWIAALKLGDIAARSLFLLVVLYVLPERSSGQFGLSLTLIALFGFLSGFERYLDLQRVLVGKSERESDRLIVSALHFFALGYALWLPPLALLLALWVKLDAVCVGLLLVIAVAEHLATEAYRIALISSRHRWLLLVSLGKNLLLLACVIVLLRTAAFEFSLPLVLLLWAALSLTSVLLAAGVFARTAAPATGSTEPEVPGFGDQYRSSRTHFIIGLVALASLQLDRLLAGALLSLEVSGIYFRHVFVAAAAYQALGVISHNRIMKGLYANVFGGDVAAARSLARRELRRYVALSVLVIIGIVLLSASGLLSHQALRSIVPAYLAGLMLAYLVRGVADYNALLLNAAYRERDIFRSQLAAVLVTLAGAGALTATWGIAGLIAAMLAGASAYLLLTSLRVREIPASPKPA
jgi:O-antigen/teichoic acid export membrane protein